MDWIKVTPKTLPEPGNDVLGYNPAWVKEVDNPDGISLCFCFESPDGLRWFHTEWDQEEDVWDASGDGSPTHWMLKPQKPE